jgi:acid stress-induced BolA-like protein IbaG/YrbA
MLSNEEVEAQLKKNEAVIEAKVEGDGYRYQLTVVSDHFIPLSKDARQQWVYAQLKEFITSGRLHAITMQTWTKEEWEAQRG